MKHLSLGFFLWGFFLFLALFLPRPLSAGEILATSELVAATVFPEGARVVRQVDLPVPKGESIIVISGLPAKWVEKSLRVEGKGSVPVLIGSVEIGQVYSDEPVREEEQRLEKELETLRDERRGIEDRTKALELQVRFIEAIGREMPKNADEEVLRGVMAPEGWKQAWTALGAGAADLYRQIHQLEIEKRRMDRKIKQKILELAQIRSGLKSTAQARIALEAGAPGRVQLTLSYQVRDAGWTPFYDARLDIKKEKVTLILLGHVLQNTGEDWSDIAMTFSTARPAEGAQGPKLSPWFIDFEPDRIALESSPLKKSVPSPMRQVLPAFGAPENFLLESVAGLLPMEMITARARMAEVRTGGFVAEYRVPGASSVPSDRKLHKFTVDEHEMPAALSVRAVPKMTLRAYLYAQMQYSGSAPILPGVVSVFRDGAFIGHSQLEMLRPEEEFKLSFGVDDQVRVEYRLQTDKRFQEGLLSKQERIERRYLISVENYHTREMEVSVLDQLPVSQDERIEVELLDGSTQPTERDMEDQKGVLAWTGSYGPKEKRVIDFGYSITYPEGKSLLGF